MTGYSMPNGLRNEAKCDRTPGPGTYETVYKWFWIQIIKNLVDGLMI